MADLSLAECHDLIKDSSLEFYVYVLVRPDGIPFYVGKGRAQRISKHERETRAGRRGHRYSIIRGILNSGGRVFYRIEGHFALEADAFSAEKRVIAEIGRRAHGGPLVNKTDGGEGPSGFSQKISPEVRAKISAALAGRKKAPEHVAKVAAKRRGCVHGAASRAKISEAVRRPESMKKIAAARFGFKHSDETKEKIRLLKTGMRYSEESNRKKGAAFRGKRHTTETRRLMAESALNRPPMNEETKAKIKAARAKQPPMSAEARAKCAEAARQMQARKRAVQVHQ